MAVVYLGIGSNLGDKKNNCLKALDGLSERGVVITKRSSFYMTKPWGIEEQPDFVNMALEVETEIPPEELLDILKVIEKEMGRRDGIRWGPRLIDLDILLYGDITVQSESLVIPHPLLHKRDFVLLPLTEIAPEAVHPALKMTISELKKRYDDETDDSRQHQIED
jgi:2-amino-4-hydroxy-6-hydroxymethyldihydropteridine diphosphokinase